MKVENKKIVSTAEIQKIVRARLAKARRRNYPADLPKSKRVLAAQKVLDEYEKRNYKHHQSESDKHQRKLNEIENAIILGDVSKVVDLLDEFGA